MALRISAGPATGRDAIFVLNGVGAECVEPELKRPVVRGRDIEPFTIKKSSAALLVPYQFESGKPRAISLSDFPVARSYLERHRAELETRHCVRGWEKAWYEFHDSPFRDLALVRKILVPDVAETNRFAIDECSFPLHSVYYILPHEGVSLEYVTAILNSPICTFVIRTTAPQVKDGFSRYRRQFVSQLPIPAVDRDSEKAVIREFQLGNFESVAEMTWRIFGVSRATRSLILGELRRLQHG